MVISPHAIHLGVGWEIAVVSTFGEQTLLLTALLSMVLSIDSFLPIFIISTYSSCCSPIPKMPMPPRTVLVIIAVSTVAICQFTRKEPDIRNIELEDGGRSDKHWPASILNKRRRRRRKKGRKKKVKDPDVTTIDLESDEIEEVEFEEDIPPLEMGGVSEGGRHVDIPKVSGLCRIFLCLAIPCGVVQQLHVLCSIFFFFPRLFISFACTSCSSLYSLRSPSVYSQHGAN